MNLTGSRRKTGPMNLLAWVILLLELAFLNLAQAQEAPRQLTLSLTGDPKTTMTVAWTTASRDLPLMEYWRDEETPQSATGTSQRLVHSGFRHTVELRGLTPGSIYNTRIGDAQYHFRTAPESADAKVSFIALGDSRQDQGETDLARWAQVAKAAAAEESDFTLFTGDMVLSGFVPRWWDMWFDAGAPLLSKAPFMVAMGNHEMASPAFDRRIATPGGASLYSFDYGPVHVSVVNTDPSLAVSTDPESFPAPLGPGSVQYAWLESDLKAVPEGMWKVVMMHRSPYSAASHGDQQDVQALVPLFDKYQVQLVVSGHDHSYQRFLPMAAGAPVPVGTPATAYVVAAGAGAPLYDVNMQDPRLAKAAKAFNYVLIHADAKTLSLEAKDAMTGQLLDAATVGKR